MPNPQQEEAPGRADAPTTDPGTPSAPDEPTLHEFLTRLATSSQDRSDFDADPRAALDQAGLGDVTATDALQATSLVLDYAPVEVVQEYDRSLTNSVEKFAASNQHVAITELHPAQPHEQEVTDLNMLQNSSEKPDFSNGGDTDAQMPAPKAENNVEVEQNDSHNLINVHDVGTDNAVGNVGGVANDLVGNLGDTVNAPVENATNTVDNTVSTVGETATSAPEGVTGLVGGVTDTAAELPVAGDVVGGLAGGGGEGPVSGVVGGVTDVAGGLPVAGPVVEGVTEPVTDALPL